MAFSGANHPFPRLGCYSIGGYGYYYIENTGPNATAAAATRDRMADLNFVIMPGGIYGSGAQRSRQSVYQDIKNASTTKGTNVVLGPYVYYDDNSIGDYAFGTYFWHVVDQMTWWVYKNGTSGAKVETSYIGSNWWIVNPTHYSPQSTGLTPSQANGLYPYQFAAWYTDQLYQRGPLSGWYAEHMNDIATNLDFYFIDNVFTYPEAGYVAGQNADITRNGSQVDWNTVLTPAWRTGQADFMNYGRSLDSNRGWGGNWNSSLPVSTETAPTRNTILDGSMDVALMEWAQGVNDSGGTSAEGYDGTDYFLKRYKYAMDHSFRSGFNGYMMVCCNNINRSNGRISIATDSNLNSTSDFQAVRYYLAEATMGNGYWGDGYWAGLTKRWDETHGGNLDTPGWLGYPLAGEIQQDSIRTGRPWSGTIYARRFDNGAVFLNRRGASDVTINLDNPFGDGVAYKRLTSYGSSRGSSTVNNGLGGNATIKGADALFTVKVGGGGGNVSGVGGYYVYRNSSKVANVTGANTTTYTDSGLAANTSYTYNVSAYDNANNESGLSNSATATTGSTFHELTNTGAVIPKLLFRFPWSQYEANLQVSGGNPSWPNTPVKQWDTILANNSPYQGMPSGSQTITIVNDRYNIDGGNVDLARLDVDLNGINGLIAQSTAKNLIVAPMLLTNGSGKTIGEMKIEIDKCFIGYPNLTGIYFGAAGTVDSIPIGGNNSANYYGYYNELATYIKGKSANCQVLLHSGGANVNDTRQTAQMWYDLLDHGNVDVLTVAESAGPVTTGSQLSAELSDPRFLSINQQFNGAFCVMFADTGAVPAANRPEIQWQIQKKYNVSYVLISEVASSGYEHQIDSVSYWNNMIADLYPAPKNLAASSVSSGGGGVQLTFNSITYPDGSNAPGGGVGCDIYNIYKDSGSGFTPIVSVTTLPYVDNDVIDGNTYTYKVIGKNNTDVRYTAFSDPVTITYHTVAPTPGTIENSYWTWMGGSQVNNTQPTFGTKGVAAPGNNPGARNTAATWTDSSGNLWLFGGWVSFSGRRDDVWQYNVTTNQWTWIAGSNVAVANPTYGPQGVYGASYTPGGRSGMSYWTDANGDFWVFGGVSDLGFYSKFGDFWKFKMSPGAGQYQWAWMGGNQTRDQAGVSGTKGVPSTGNYPGSRAWTGSWVDSSGNLWLFGGRGHNNSVSGYLNEYYLNDLWRYNPTTGAWTWVSGNADGNSTGVWGSQGVGNVNNIPYGRSGVLFAKDSLGNFWLYGGYGPVPSNGDQYGYNCWNDLWKYNVASNEWTWVAGIQTAGQNGVYGGSEPTGVEAPGIYPGCRRDGAMWCDTRNSLWIFGGSGKDAFVSSNSGGPNGIENLNDFWRFRPSTGLWAWFSGSNHNGQPATFNTQGQPNISTTPGSVMFQAYWIYNDHIWTMGGEGPIYHTNGENNDLFKR